MDFIFEFVHLESMKLLALIKQSRIQVSIGTQNPNET